MIRVNWPKIRIRLLTGTVYQSLVLMIYILDYLLVKILDAWGKSRICPKFIVRLTDKLAARLNSHKEGTVSRIDLIELSWRNMKVKRTRTWVTVGGMTIGIAVIVFLVSIGYGLQHLVVSRVARLEEMKQANISRQAGSQIKIDDKTMSDLKRIVGVNKVLPLIAVVGRVSYQNSVSDMAVYGVTSDYLWESAIKPKIGKIFESNQTSIKLKTETSEEEIKGEVEGVFTMASGETVREVEFEIEPDVWLRVRQGPSISDKIIGYTKRAEGVSLGKEVWGEEYKMDDEAVSNKWIKAAMLVWRDSSCWEEIDCLIGQKDGFVAEIGMTIKDNEAELYRSQVLGISDEDRGLDWVEIGSESATNRQTSIKRVEIGSDAKREAVVSMAMLNVLGIKENEALGEKFKVSYVVVGELLSSEGEKVESTETEYAIIGVIPEEKAAIFYVPFIDLRSLGVNNYSQIKLVVNDDIDLSRVRRQVEAMGYTTRSVADTVAQINSLFGTVRTLLTLLGMMALSVAALGMFNTLTVSLLERTREVGLMKAMGMKSSEVWDLFLTESMIMGLTGGVLGVLLGFMAGKVLALVLSLFAVVKGAGVIDITFIPISFAVLVVVLSFLVGILTGIYPAKRATKISALNALRYE